MTESNNRWVAIFGCGPSLSKTNPNELAKLDVEFIGINDCFTIEDKLLTPISRKFNIVTQMCFVSFRDYYPKICEYLDRPDDNYAIICEDSFEYIQDKKVEFFEKYKGKVRLCPYLGLGNSVYVLLIYLFEHGIKNILLFGVDGVVSELATHFEGIILPDDVSAPYYKTRIQADTENFNKYFLSDAETLGFTGFNVINCNPESHINVFPKLSLKEVLATCPYPKTGKTS